MILRLVRPPSSPHSTIGDLYVNNLWECFTLEDVCRKGTKVPGETAIPDGTYKVIVDFSTRFKRPLPHIINVPGFEGIRIHPGNTAEDTEGCILVGRIKQEDRIASSRLAFDTLFSKIQTALQTEEVSIVIVHEKARAQEEELVHERVV